MKDYFGNDINIGDTILYVGKNSNGGRVSFSESVVTEFDRGCVVVKSYNHHSYKTTDLRQPKNVINLSALGLKPQQTELGFIGL